MYRWYVINTYSGHENKVKHNLEHRVQTMSQNRNVRQVVVPTEQVSEMKDGQKVQWPDRDTLVQATAVTILFVVVAAAYLGALDAVFNWLIKQIL